MIEVFKTSVLNRDHANMLVYEIHKNFINYKANFDLEDCDKILRVECTAGSIRPGLIIQLLQKFGFKAEVLPDELEPVGDLFKKYA
ncbi:MAG: hypothetical protein ABIO76_08875 [Ginsengibacter sp.]